MGMIDAVKIMRDAELKAESNKITLGEYEAMIRPLRQVMTKADYENRLKADMVAMLTEIQLEIAELPVHVVSNKGSIIRMEIVPSAEDVYEVIQEKINALKGNNND